MLLDDLDHELDLLLGHAIFQQIAHLRGSPQPYVIFRVAELDQLLHHSFFACDEEIRLLDSTDRSCMIVRHSLQVRLDALLRHVADELSRYLVECFLSETVRVIFEITEGNELHNISLHLLLELLGVERTVVCVKYLH